MLEYILIALGVLLNLIGEGMTEGFTFATPERRLVNPLIQLRFRGKGKGIFGYHMVRILFENGGAMTLLLGTFFYTGILFHYLWFLVGMMLIGIFVYERCFNIVSYGKLFPQKAPYYFWKWKIERKPWQDFVILALGIALIWLYFKYAI